MGCFIIAGLVILISSFKKPEETPKKYLTMSVTRTGMRCDAMITIISETGKTETIEMEGGQHRDALLKNTAAINSTINKIAGQGYTLQFVDSDNFATTSALTNYIFQKN